MVEAKQRRESVDSSAHSEERAERELDRLRQANDEVDARTLACLNERASLVKEVG